MISSTRVSMPSNGSEFDFFANVFSTILPGSSPRYRILVRNDGTTLIRVGGSGGTGVSTSYPIKPGEYLELVINSPDRLVGVTSEIGTEANDIYVLILTNP